MTDEQDCQYVELGLSSASVYRVLNRGLKRRELNELSQFTLEAIQRFISYYAS